ncbi:MAG: M48 family metallopeptidase [Algicola sp.]|nr:M48 family metallopeptidase [Algicola sp.]
MQNEVVQAQGFVAQICRTPRRKTATITVEAGEVMVKVPQDLALDRITKLLQDKHSWIADKIRLHQAITSVDGCNKSERQFVSGEAYSYLGRNYRLKVNRGNYRPIKLANGRFVVTLLRGGDNPNMVKRLLTDWYKSHAQTKLTEKAKRYAKMIGVECASIGIKDYKSRWGSCSVEGNIDFNWLIMMAPNRIVDYVVVHELCHLLHHDHSALFWQAVGRTVPDYGECKDWLKVHGAGLVL